MPNYDSAYTGTQIDQAVGEAQNEQAATTTALRNVSPATAQRVRVLGGAEYVWVDGDVTIEVTRSSGTTTSASTSKLQDSGATFSTDGVIAGDTVNNTTDGTSATVSSVDSEIQLTLSADIFTSGEAYSVGYNNKGLYLTSGVSGYGVGEANEGRWKAQHSGTVSSAVFGVAADGVTDDTVAMQAALDSGLEIVLPKNATIIVDDANGVTGGVALYNHALDMSTQGTRIVGRNTTIKANDSDAAYSLMWVTGDNCIIEGITFDANYAGSGTVSGNGCLKIHTENTTVRDCIFQNAASHAIVDASGTATVADGAPAPVTVTTRGTTVDRCLFKTLATSGIITKSGGVRYARYTNLEFDACGTVCIKVDGETVPSGGTYARQVIISDIVVHDIALGDYHTDIAGQGAIKIEEGVEDVIISNVTIRNCKNTSSNTTGVGCDGIQVTTSSQTDKLVSRVRISNVVITDVDGNGIKLGTNTTSEVSDVTIDGVDFYDVEGKGVTVTATGGNEGLHRRLTIRNVKAYQVGDTLIDMSSVAAGAKELVISGVQGYNLERHGIHIDDSTAVIEKALIENVFFDTVGVTVTTTDNVTVASGVTVPVSAIGGALKSGAVVRFAAAADGDQTGKGTLTLTANADRGATSLVGDLTVANIVSGDIGREYCYGIWIESASVDSDILIRNADCRRANTHGIFTQAGELVLQNCSGSYCNRSGIWIQGNGIVGQSLATWNNQQQPFGTSGDQSHAGIALAVTSQDCVFMGLVSFDTQAAPTQDWGVLLGSSTLNNFVMGVQAWGVVLKSIRDAGTSNTVTLLQSGVVTDYASATTPVHYLDAGQQAAIVSLTDSTGGTGNDTLAAISGSGDDAEINNNFADLRDKVEEILAVMRTHGLIAT